MSNPIPRSSLFGTPESLVALQEQIAQLPPEQKSIAYLYTMLAFNLAYKLVEQEKAAAMY